MDICAERRKRRVYKLAPYDHDDIEGLPAGGHRAVRLRVPKNLAHAALRSISHHGRSDLA